MPCNNLHNTGSIAGIVCILLGLSVLAGWWLDIDSLKSLLSGLSSMKANTALCFILTGTALVTRYINTGPARWTGWICLIPVVMISLLTLIQHMTGVDFGIDELLVRDLLTAGDESPGRMPFAISLAFLLSASALLLLDSRMDILRRYYFSSIAIFSVIAIGGMVFTGYVFSIELFHTWFSAGTIALHTSIGLLVLGIGLWHLRNTRIPRENISDYARIIYIAALAVFAAALVAGNTGFAVLQLHIERILADDLQAELNTRINQLEQTMNLRTVLAQTITTNPGVLKHMRLLISGSTQAAGSKSLVQAELESLAAHGFSYITVYSPAGEEIAHSGERHQTAAFEVPVAAKIDTALLWRNGVYLRLRQELQDQEGILGTVVSEQFMHNTTTTLLTSKAFGESVEFQLCRGMRTDFHCLPNYLSSEPFTIPATTSNGPTVIAYAARGDSGFIKTIDSRGIQVFSAYAPVGHTGLSAALKIKAYKILQPMVQKLEQALLLIILLSIIGVAFVRHSVQPLATLLEKQAHELKLGEEKYRTLMESIQDGILVAQDQHFVYCNPALAEMLGYTIEEVLTLPFDAVIAPEFIRTWKSRYKQRINFQEKEPVNKYEIRIIPKKNMADIWVELHAERIYYNNRPAALYILRDITERKKTADSLRKDKDELLEKYRETAEEKSEFEYLATRDPLTGVFNRRYLNDTLQRELVRAQRDNTELSLALLDIDYFKKLNDTYGHDGGDAALKAFADLLVKSTRSSDIICRYGGEEFLIVMPATGLHIAQQRLEQIRQAFGDMRINYGQEQIHTTVSIGVAAFPVHGKSAREIIKAADQALYAAKGGGRNRVIVCQ
jgi:diguanylate cyclase (GGDEF)-like protein/PAS domain S-box-containing protein